MKSLAHQYLEHISQHGPSSADTLFSDIFTRASEGVYGDETFIVREFPDESIFLAIERTAPHPTPILALDNINDFEKSIPNLPSTYPIETFSLYLKGYRQAVSDGLIPTINQTHVTH